MAYSLVWYNDKILYVVLSKSRIHFNYVSLYIRVHSLIATLYTSRVAKNGLKEAERGLGYAGNKQNGIVIGIPK